MPLRAHQKDRLRLLLASIGVAVVAIPLFIAVVVLFPGLNHVHWKWVRFTAVTTFFVVYCLKTHWRARKHLRFWAILLGILIIHFLGLGYFYYAGLGLPLILFGPAVALEWALFAIIVYHVLGIGPAVSKHRESS